MDFPEQRSLWIIDDDLHFAEALREVAEAGGYRVHVARRHHDVLADADLRNALAILEPRLPDGFSLHVLDRLVGGGGGRAVVVTRYPSVAAAVASIRLGAVDYISKPVDVKVVFRILSTGACIDEIAQIQRGQDEPSLAKVEWEHMWQVLMRCGGNISQAARAMKLHRQSLQRKLQKFPPAG